MKGLAQDLRYALRRVGKHRGFTATAVLTLALGIGCATALFSVVDGVLLRPFPWKDPDRLVALWIVRPHWREMLGLTASWDRGVLSWPNFRDVQQNAHVLESVAVWRASTPVLSGEYNEAPQAMLASSGFLATLGVPPALGRFFDPHEVLAAVVNTTVVAGENLTVGSTVWLPAESVAPGR